MDQPPVRKPPEIVAHPQPILDTDCEKVCSIVMATF